MTRAPEIIDFNLDCDDIAVIRMDEDDETWWRIVADHAMENEYRYGLDETTETVTDDKDEYVDALVLAWVKANVETPRWRWHRKGWVPEDERDDEYEWELLTSSTQHNRLWWRGAVVRTRATGTAEVQTEGDR